MASLVRTVERGVDECAEQTARGHERQDQTPAPSTVRTGTATILCRLKVLGANRSVGLLADVAEEYLVNHLLHGREIVRKDRRSLGALVVLTHVRARDGGNLP